MKKLLQRLTVVLAVAALWPTIAYAAITSVAATVQFSATFTETVDGGIQTDQNVQAISPGTLQYAYGTGSNQVNLPYAAKLSLVASTPQTIDLSSLTDLSGNTLDFSRVREFIVQNTATTAGYDVTVSQGATNGWAILPATGGIPVRYGAIIRISDPVSTGAGNGNIASGTSKTIKFDPGSNNVTIYVWIIGGSAAFVVFPFGLRRYRRRLAA